MNVSRRNQRQFDEVDTLNNADDRQRFCPGYEEKTTSQKEKNDPEAKGEE